MKKKILVVDDEADIVELLSYNLKNEGFDVTSSYNGEDALKKLQNRREKFDLVILDLMLPGIQGMDVLRAIKASPATASLPVIMLTAKGDEVDKVLGLEMGADDYVTKPFGIRELVSRAKTVMRRSAPQPGETGRFIVAGALELDTQMFAAKKDGRVLDLSATEFGVLLCLVKARGRVMTRDMLLDLVWKNEAFVEPRTVDVHVSRLRSQIEDDPANPVYVKTRRGVGYYFETDL
jgi:DNA-binding response OmpR family regulator